MSKLRITIAPEVHHEKPVVSLSFEKDYFLVVKDEALAGKVGLLSLDYFNNAVPSTQKGGIIFKPFIVVTKRIIPSKSDNFM